MKQSKLIVVVLIIMIIFGWGTAFLAEFTGDSNEYDNHLELAAEYVDRGLYQKAVEEYDLALKIKNTEDVYTLKMEAYEKRYSESIKIYEEYLSATKTGVSQFPNNEEFLLTLVNLYTLRDEYEAAYKALNKAVENGLNSDKIQALISEIKYSYTINWKAYTGYRTCVNGFYAVSETGVWTYIEEDGSETDISELVMAGPVGENGYRVIQNKVRGEIIDTNEVVQGVVADKPVDAGMFSEGLVAIKAGEFFSYYNSLGDKQFGNYTEAGAFAEGQAAVNQSGKWKLIDTKGKDVSKDVYEDIVIHSNGKHIKNGVMIAKKNGVYSFYNDGKSYGKFSDVDIVTDDNIVAVCQDGKWGFVDLDGKEVIKPTYKEALSFSNGLAAVSDGESWGFIDKNGKLVIDYTFYGADYFNSQSSCMVETGEESTWQLITLNIKE